MNLIKVYDVLNKYLITDISKIVVDLYDDNTHIPNTIYEVYISVRSKGIDWKRNQRYYSSYRDATDLILSYVNKECGDNKKRYNEQKKTLTETGSVALVESEVNYYFTLREVQLMDLIQSGSVILPLIH